MAAVLNSVCDAIETLWEAETPPDRTDVTYKRCERKAVPEGIAGHRQFYFMPSASGVEGQCGVFMTERTWTLKAFMRLAEAGRNLKTHQEAIANEMNLLLRSIEEDSFSGVSGLVGVETTGCEVDFADNGDAILEFTMDVYTQETD